MAIESKTYYLIKRQGTFVAIELLHYVSNQYAAEKAMMAAYGLTSGDIQTKSAGTLIWSKTNACSTFDGRNAH